MRVFYFIGGLFFLFLGKICNDQDLFRYHLYNEGQIVEMTLNRKTSFRNKHTLKLFYEENHYFLDVAEDFYDNHHTWDKIKVKYLKGHSTVFFPEYKYSDQKIVNNLFFAFGIFCMVLTLNLFPKFNEWFEREKTFKSHF